MYERQPMVYANTLAATTFIQTPRLVEARTQLDAHTRELERPTDVIRALTDGRRRSAAMT